jgi:hypothetical protein
MLTLRSAPERLMPRQDKGAKILFIGILASRNYSSVGTQNFESLCSIIPLPRNYGCVF